MSSGCSASISSTNIPASAPAKTPTPAKTMAAAAATAMLPSLAPSSARGGGGGGGTSATSTPAPASNTSTPTVSGGGGATSSRIPLPRPLNGFGGGVRRSASMRLRGEKYHGLLAAGASASSLTSSSRGGAVAAAAAAAATRASASSTSLLWGGGGGEGGGGGGASGRQCPSISEGAAWRALRGSATAENGGWRTANSGATAPSAGVNGGGGAARYYRSLSLSGGGSSGVSFPTASADTLPRQQQTPQQQQLRRARGASLSFCPVDDQLLLDDVLDATRPTAGDEEDDASSLRSFGSACSTMSCDHAYFARNGTTFSGRRMKYVVHCSPHAGETEEYLTPTQRAARQIRRLKSLLQQAQREINKKDQDIFRLTKEVVELRLFKASLGAPPTHDDDEEPSRTTVSADSTGTRSEERSGDSSDVVEGVCGRQLDDERLLPPPGALPLTHSEDLEEVEHSPRSLLLQLHTDHTSQGGEKTSSPSLADSGHFEDIVTTPEPPTRSLTRPFASPSSPAVTTAATPLPTSPHLPPPLERGGSQSAVEVEVLRRRLIEQASTHVREAQELKERHNDRVEALLQRLSIANDQYCELRAEYERAQDKIRLLEKEAESLRKNMNEHEERHKSMYLKMYMKGQEAARFEHADQVLEFAHKAPSRVSVPELLQQLQVAESELENMKQETDLRHTLAPKSALLSAREALSLWLLGTRKAMYRRIVESRAKKGELDPEITLQFLKSAIYYFLTDKENHQGHLNAIESILGYNENEKLNIEKAYKMYVRK